jgi:hypothetical protein
VIGGQLSDDAGSCEVTCTCSATRGRAAQFRNNYNHRCLVCVSRRSEFSRVTVGSQICIEISTLAGVYYLLSFPLRHFGLTYLTTQFSLVPAARFIVCPTAVASIRPRLCIAPRLASMAPFPPARASTSHSISPGASSDKENHQNSTRVSKRNQQTAMSSSASTKRQRLARRTSNLPNGSQSRMPLTQQDRDRQYYDPDQDERERRRVRKGLRDLTRELNGTTMPILPRTATCPPFSDKYVP